MNISIPQTKNFYKKYRIDLVPKNWVDEPDNITYEIESLYGVEPYYSQEYNRFTGKWDVYINIHESTSCTLKVSYDNPRVPNCQRELQCITFFPDENQHKIYLS